MSSKVLKVHYITQENVIIAKSMLKLASIISNRSKLIMLILTKTS